jgi:hypothetical protein
MASYLETESGLLNYLYLKIHINFQMLLFLQHEFLTSQDKKKYMFPVAIIILNMSHV